MRRYLPALLLALAALGPFSLVLTGCDLLKPKGDADAAAGDAAPAVAATTAAVGTATTPPTVAPTIAPTMPTVTPTGTVTVRPPGADASTPATDGGVKTDAGVVPVPTLNIPHLFDAGNPFKGFDAGGFKIPTFPK
jgi:hypothetical protein